MQLRIIVVNNIKATIMYNSFFMLFTSISKIRFYLKKVAIIAATMDTTIIKAITNAVPSRLKTLKIPAAINIEATVAHPAPKFDIPPPLL